MEDLDWKYWESPIFKCTDCGQAIVSLRIGEFVQCGCGKAFVDATPHYVRTSANVEDTGETVTLKYRNRTKEEQDELFRQMMELIDERKT